MDIIRFPDPGAVNETVAEDRKLIASVLCSGEAAAVCPADEISDHSLLLASCGIFGTQARECFRVRFDSSFAEWEFDCPAAYQGESDRQAALGSFYRDGLRIIPEFLTLMGYFPQLSIKNITGELWDF